MFLNFCGNPEDSFETLDLYFIGGFIIIKYKSSSIKDRIHLLKTELWPLISEVISTQYLAYLKNELMDLTKLYIATIALVLTRPMLGLLDMGLAQSVAEL